VIGVFDSGIGGLSVLAAIADVLPHADLVYFADSAHLPYGERDETFIRDRVLTIGGHLADLGCTLLVVACNTATAAAIADLRATLPRIAVVGVEPGIKPAAAASKSGRIAVLATTSTARSERLADLIRRHASKVCVDIIACPGWATEVETLRLDAFVAGSELEAAIEAGADRIVLGCTHYSFLAGRLAPILAGRASLVDVATAVARQCQRLAAGGAHGDGRLTLLASARPEHLQAALMPLGLQRLAARLRGPARAVAA
jgi:glutamate racemase